MKDTKGRTKSKIQKTMNIVSYMLVSQYSYTYKKEIKNIRVSVYTTDMDRTGRKSSSSSSFVVNTSEMENVRP